MEMQKPKVKEAETPADAEMLQARMPLTFHNRQFHAEPTRRQKTFDWVFGVGLPLVCFAADPIVFRKESDLLHEYKTFAYVLGAVSIMAMAAWLLWGQKLGELRPYLGGLFIAGSIVSLIVGLILSPFSMMGIFVLIGFLGFTPFFSAYVYLRNGARAIADSKLDMPKSVVYRAAILAALYSLIVPFVLNS